MACRWLCARRAYIGIREVHFGVGGKRKKWGGKLIIQQLKTVGYREIETGWKLRQMQYIETTHWGQIWAQLSYWGTEETNIRWMSLISEMLAFALHRMLATHLLTLMTNSNTAKGIPNMLELLLKVAYFHLTCLHKYCKSCDCDVCIEGGTMCKRGICKICCIFLIPLVPLMSQKLHQL